MSIIGGSLVFFKLTRLLNEVPSTIKRAYYSSLSKVWKSLFIEPMSEVPVSKLSNLQSIPL